MSRYLIDFYSQSLGMYTTLNIFIPKEKMRDIEEGKKLKSVTLLHGYSENASIWGRNSNVEADARKYGYALIIPEVQKSFYTDMAFGLKYFTYLKNELFKYTRAMFPISSKSEDSYIMGNSMGGYGAFKIALSKPFNYSKAYSIAGCLDMKAYIAKNGIDVNEIFAIYGSYDNINDEDDLFFLYNKNAKCEKFPKLMISCGLDDDLYGLNKSFLDFVLSKNNECEYIENHGKHTWDYFSKMVLPGFRFFNSKK